MVKSTGLIQLYRQNPARSSAVLAGVNQFTLLYSTPDATNRGPRYDLLRMRFVDTLYWWISPSTVSARLAFGALQSARIQQSLWNL